MIDGRGQARITDFGLARLANSAIGQGEIAGTPAYMAPEQFARGETTIRSDLYSLGRTADLPGRTGGSIDIYWRGSITLASV